MKSKIILGLFVVYGIIIATAYHVHSQQVNESALYLFNFIVEKYIIPPILLYFANDVGNAIIGNSLLVLRILVSIAFWGGITSSIFLLMGMRNKK